MSSPAGRILIVDDELSVRDSLNNCFHPAHDQGTTG